MGGRRILAGALIVLLVIVVGATVWGIRYTNSPDFCDSCHIIQPYVAAWKTSYMGSQQNVKCIDCHFEPGVLGYARGKIYSLMKLFEWGTQSYDRPPPSADLLTNSSCLQCHGNQADRKPGYESSHSVTDPNDPTYPKIAVTDQYSPDKRTIYFPHDFHVNQVQLNCSDCHSGVVHGAELTGDKPQAAADPAFCATCHSGDVAPIIFGPITPSGREHPGAPKLDTAIWRNNHWKLAKGPGEIDGVQYDQIEKQTCLACHKEPTEAKNCKSCHFHTAPTFAPTQEAQRASGAPLAMFGLVIGIFMITLVPWPKAKRYIFEGWLAVILAVAVFATDVYAGYRVIVEVVTTTSGDRSIGPLSLWIAYLLASASLLIFLFHQGVLKPRRRRLSGNDRD